MDTNELQRTLDAVWRIESAKIIAALTRHRRDLGLAEEAGAGRIVAAMEQWPKSGARTIRAPGS